MTIILLSRNSFFNIFLVNCQLSIKFQTVSESHLFFHIKNRKAWVYRDCQKGGCYITNCIWIRDWPKDCVV